MPEALLAFALTAIAVELTPGPNMAYLAILSIDRGRAAGVAAVAGVALGLALLGLAAGFGLGTLIAETRWLYETLRWAGVAYLLWLAFDTWRESRLPVGTGDSGGRVLLHFRRGLVTNLLNPKAAIFYITVLPNFVDPDASVAGQSLMLTAVYVAIATAIHAAIVIAAGSLRPLIASERLRRGLGIAFALLLVGIAVWLAISTRRAW